MLNRRRTFLVEKDLQWRLARRLIATWIIGGLMILSFPILATFLYGLFVASIPPQTLVQGIVDSLWFPLLTAVLIIPIGVRDSIRFSNRIAGPIYRLKREMRTMADGGMASEVHLRNGDFLTDLADDFNRVAQRVRDLEAQTHQSLAESSGESQDATETAIHKAIGSIGTFQENLGVGQQVPSDA